MSRRGPRISLGLAVAICVPACVAPARTTSAYDGKAAATAASVVSAARTVLVAAHAAADGSMFAPTVAVTVADAETDAASARDAFVSIQPPDAASDRVRAALLTDVQRAVDIIELVRIAARRSEIGDLERVAMPLQDLAARLDRFATRYG